MTGTDKQGVSPRRGGRLGHRAKRVLQMLGMLVIAMIVALGMAHWGVNHPGESAALRDWVHSTRYGWLSWRLALYAVLAWGFLENLARAGLQTEYRQPLKRMAIACAVFALACEYSLFGGGLTL